MYGLDPDNIPDIVLANLNILVMNGYKLARKIKEMNLGIKVLALKVENSEEVILKCLKTELADIY